MIAGVVIGGKEVVLGSSSESTVFANASGSLCSSGSTESSIIADRAIAKTINSKALWAEPQDDQKI